MSETSVALFHRVNFSDNIINSNAGALITKISTASISCPGGIEGAIMSQDVKGNHFQLVKNAHQHMEDFTPLENLKQSEFIILFFSHVNQV